MAIALLLSPHLDDAVFSCGGTILTLVRRGWRVVVATVFTRSVHPATGFALACQRDKGLGDDVDYMALRRGEDADAVAMLGAETLWLDLPEAPHRGYETAPALFSEFVSEDGVAASLETILDRTMRDLNPDLLLAPAALGGHVDHRRVLDAVIAVGGDHAVAFWHDVPYIIRDPDAVVANPVLASLENISLPIPDALDLKTDAAVAYRSQTRFQFGGDEQTVMALRQLALQQGEGVAAERFHATPAAMRMLRP